MKSSDVLACRFALARPVLEVTDLSRWSSLLRILCSAVISLALKVPVCPACGQFWWNDWDVACASRLLLEFVFGTWAPCCLENRLWKIPGLLCSDETRCNNKSNEMLRNSSSKQRSSKLLHAIFLRMICRKRAWLLKNIGQSPSNTGRRPKHAQFPIRLLVGICQVPLCLCASFDGIVSTFLKLLTLPKAHGGNRMLSPEFVAGCGTAAQTKLARRLSRLCISVTHFSLFGYFAGNRACISLELWVWRLRVELSCQC